MPDQARSPGQPVIPESSTALDLARTACLRLADVNFALGPLFHVTGLFLAADDLGSCPAWRAAIRPEPAQVAAQLRRDGLGALPWGPISAAFRGKVG